MRRITLVLHAACVAAILTAFATPLRAQGQQGRTEAELRTLWEQHKGDFDYLRPMELVPGCPLRELVQMPFVFAIGF